ncbi:MAG: hypothetical protein JNN11_03665 [Candidatus Doudnabacteria bacterium]|nr:hypothetical protein [Candidatus Doudnabacteria bacterium]
MDKLESQIARIQLFSPKQAGNFVFVSAEKATGSEAELYMVAELPLFNPAAADQCAKICQAVWGVLKRSYKKPLEESSFENMVAQVNEELGHMAETGQNYWINKFNCILAVKHQETFSITTCGKTTAFLLREGSFADISTANGQNHPLKTFDSFANGKIKLNDILILSNTQLLNFISVDRLKEVLKKDNFLAAAQTVIELLKETAGPAVAFGTIFNLQLPYGQGVSEEVDLENYIVENPYHKTVLSKVTEFIKSMTATDKSLRQNKADLPKISASERFAMLKKASKQMLSGTREGLTGITGKIINAGQAVSPRQIKKFSPGKKYLLGSIAIFLIAAVLSVSAAVYNKNIKQKQQNAAAQFELVTQNLSLAESALLYKDEKLAKEYLALVEQNLPTAENISKDQKEQLTQASQRLENLKNQFEKKNKVEAVSLGNLASTNELLDLNEFLAVTSGQSIITYEKSSGKIEDGRLKTEQPILNAYAFKSGQAAVYNGEALSIWNYQTGQTGSPLISSVPPKDTIAGLAFYPTNNRIYLIDRQKSQIISFQINQNTLQKPVVSISEPGLSAAEDLAIDSSIYVLKPTGIVKFSAGKLAAFEMPFLFDSYTGGGKIYTQVGWKNLYLLDIAKKRLLIMDKQGNMINMLVSDKFTDLKDFVIDEENKTIYLLNGTELLKVNF